MGRPAAAVTAGVGAVAATVVLLSGCAEADGGTGRGAPAPASEWVEPENYRFTLSMFAGKCGDDDKAEGSWAITVADGSATRAEPLGEAARARSWAEGAPTIGELHGNALAVREGGAYDVVDIEYVENGADAGRPVRIHYLDRDDTHGDYEGCTAITDFGPAG